MTNELSIRNMTRTEVDELVAWAAREGWNPGLHDAELFWATDPEAFIAADLDGELIGGGAITSYNGEFGFMGFFIVRPEFRGRGFGNTLWHARRERLLERLRPARASGWTASLRCRTTMPRAGSSSPTATCVFASRSRSRRTARRTTAVTSSRWPTVPFDQVLDYDRTCFPAPAPDLPERVDLTARCACAWLSARREAARVWRGATLWRRLQDRSAVRR